MKRHVYDKELYDGITLQEIIELYDGKNFKEIQICGDGDIYEETGIQIYTLRLETDEEYNIRIEKER